LTLDVGPGSPVVTQRARKSSRNLEGDSLEAAAALREAVRLFERRSEEVTRSHGLTARGYALLLMVKTGREADGTATPDELERRLQLAKSTVAELVQRNEESGLIRRRPHPERPGSIVVSLTRKGEQRLLRVFDELGTERDVLFRLVNELVPR
jgi:DNA-binding MarR family transcriptional regulator